MTDDIATLILEHGESIFPYLKIRAQYAKEGRRGKVVVDTDENLTLLERSGFVKVNKLSTGYEVTLYEDESRWLYQPKNKKRKRAEDKPFIPPKLEELAELVGYPDDWQKNPGKYRSLYLKTTQIRATHPELVSLVNKLKEKKIEVTLPSLLSERGFKFYSSVSNKKTVTHEDRVAAADYSEDQAF